MRAAVYIMGVIGLVPFILFRPWIGIPAWNAFGLINPQSLMWGFAETFPYAMIVGAATLVGLTYARDRKAPPLTAQTVLLALLAAWMTFTTLFAWTPESAWTEWEKVMKILLMTFVALILIHGETRIRAMILSVVVPLALLGIKGGLFTIASGGVYRVQGPGGFLGGNTEIGLAFAMALPLIVAAGHEQKRGWVRLGIWAAFWLTVLATVFTYSRGALLGLAAVMPLLFLRLKHKLPVVILVIPLLVFAAVTLVPKQLTERAATIETYDQDNSAMGRIQAWGVAWNVARTHPLGAGFNLHMTEPDRWLGYANFDIPGERKTLAAHSIYFQMLGDHGFLGLALFLALLATTFHTLGVVRRDAAQVAQHAWMARYAAALRIGLVGYAVSGAFLSLAYFDLFYTFVALSIVMQRELKRAAAQQRTAPAPMRAAQVTSATRAT